jgi:hypothetical protein
MRAYVLTTGTIFGLITVAHILRMITENPRLAVDPWYLGITLLAAGLCVWAAGLLRASRGAKRE